MVTIGVRMEPEERDQLARMAEARGLTLCALVRDLLRSNLKAGDS